MEVFFFFSSRRRHTRFSRDWSSDVCSSDLGGLSAVGRMPPGSFGGTNFAAGMGGALQGGEVARTAADARARADKNDLFNQSSTAFKDMLAAQAAKDRRALAQAHARYYDAQAGMSAQGVK